MLRKLHLNERMNSTSLWSEMSRREEAKKKSCSLFLWKCSSMGFLLLFQPFWNYTAQARSNSPAAEVRALPPQLLNLTNYTWVYSNTKKCALCSWPLGHHRDQIPGHRKAPLIFIKSHGRPALHFCSEGEQGTGCHWTKHCSLRSEQHGLFIFCSLAADQLVPRFLF